MCDDGWLLTTSNKNILVYNNNALQDGWQEDEEKETDNDEK